MNVPEPFAGRLIEVRRRMKARGLSALIVLRPENRCYLSGYTAEDSQLDESSGCLYLSARRQVLLTDFRYKTQAETEAKGFDVVIHTSGPVQELARLARHHHRVIGFEEDITTVRFHRLLREEIPNAELNPVSGLVEELRSIKDSLEVKRITRALGITEAALRSTWKFLEPGRTELEVARFLESTMKELGADELAFESIVASGPNAALPHAVPSGRRIREGETIVFDCGARRNQYRSDMTRTIILGRPKPWIREIYTIVRQAQLAAIRGMKPGMMTNEVDALARSVIEDAGYGPYFGHGLGHGVGLATHEFPSLSRLRPTRLEPGMVVTVEPGIYLEGRGGVRLEEMVLVTPQGARVLNKDQTFYDWEA